MDKQDILILLIKKHRLYILAAMVAGFFLGVFYFFARADLYYVKTTVYVTAAPEINNMESGDDIVYGRPISSGESYVFQFMFLYSDEMEDALITNFKLYEHYHIDPLSPYAHDRLNKILLKRLTLVNNSLRDVSVFDIVYKDENEAFAVKMVNYVTKKLGELNKKFLLEKLNTKAEFYKMHLKSINAESEQVSDKLAGQLKAFNNILANYKTESSQLVQLIKFQNSLESLTADLTRVNRRFNSTNEIYNYTLQSINNDSYVIVRPITKAITQAREVKQSLLIYGTISIVAVLFFYIGLLYSKVYFLDDFKIIFSK